MGSEDAPPTRTLSEMSHLYMALVGCVMKTRPWKLVFERTYGREAAWSIWKLEDVSYFSLSVAIKDLRRE